MDTNQRDFGHAQQVWTGLVDQTIGSNCDVIALPHFAFPDCSLNGIRSAI